MKRMTHPLHGFHHPLSGAEEQTMLANGWTYEAEAPVVVDDRLELVVKTIDSAFQPARRTRGPNKPKD